MSRRVPPEILAAMGGVDDVTDEQWDAISMPLEPYVLIAGAGSGKTSVMAARVVYLALAAIGRVAPDGGTVNPGVRPGNMLCLTFTNKATDNLRVKVRHALASVDLPEGEEPEILNYHGFAAQILERYGTLAGIEPGRRVLSPAQRSELCGQVLEEMTDFQHVKAEWQPSVVSKILELDDQAQNHLVTPQRIIEFNIERLEALKDHRSDRAYRSSLERIELAQAGAIYRRLKLEKGVIDYGDQIEQALTVVRAHPEVSRDYRARFEAVLLDEYQDTNVAQALLMRGVFGDGHPVTAVGDPDQNIYAWRGASLFNLFEFQRQFARADGSPARRLPLYTNFRSGAKILAAADTIIGSLPADQRPDPDKRLVAWEQNGQGSVHVVAHLDEHTEAAWIADRILELRDGGAAWSDVAVLCRTSKFFESLQRVFGDRDIPVEIVNLAGLLKLPEVIEVLAYARSVLDPMASVALARILLGPRYRIGYKDLALVAAVAKTETRRLMREDEEEGEANPFLFAEALERLDEVEGLSEKGRSRLQEFRDELRELRVEARRPVGDFLGEVIRRIGLLAELDADPDERTAGARRRNLAAFLDEVHAFEPVEGDLTLRSFLDYVDAVERLEKEEWAPVQLSDDDAVKVMTIHVAKGLEFDHVFVPGVANGRMPSKRIQQNPAERGKSLDFELRGDAAILPTFDGVLSHFKEALQRQEVIEERRTMYVALTRARRSLWVSASEWYGENVNARGPSEFFRELADWGDGAGAEVDRAEEIVVDENPLLGYRLGLVRPWPEPAQPDGADRLFADGWRRAAAEAADAGAVQPQLVDALPPAERDRFDGVAATNRSLATHLVDREAADGGLAVGTPTRVSVGGVVDFARCPKRFYWTSVRPLPRFSGPAARRGTEVHRWIELRGAGQTSLIEIDAPPDLTADELSGEPGKVARLQDAFLASRFADRTPLFAERPFLLRLDGFTVSGRIDAIYGADLDAPWEVVDWKTGSKPADDDALVGLQLDLYGLACVEIWRKRPEDVTLTYLYLAGPDEVTSAMRDPAEVRERVLERLHSIRAGAFDPTPGPQCRYCDFRSFCDAGTSWLQQDRERSSVS
ncbi:MAG: ATP-dependent helicase UvrD/PcrA [Actinomycetota bacterium]|nr:ATP-dependent helicase UvrD/PcrA [Actinomycetota bacterium]